MKSNFSTLLSIFLIFATISLTAQDIQFPDLDVSPLDAAHYPRRAAFQNYLDADDPDRTQIMKVVYSRPYKKDRNIFGELLKFGELWRLGANEATEVTFYQPVEIAGKYVSSGTYTMLAELHQDHWIWKLSKERFVAGTSNLDASQHIISTKIATSKVDDVREQFTIGFQKIDDYNVHMVFEWDQTQARLPINLNVTSMAGKDASPMDLAQYPNSSRFRNFQKPEDLDKAIAKVRVVYSRPQKKGRDIFGGLLKYGEMWRVGANETTTISFYSDVTIGGTDIRSGTYGLFAVVNEDNWEFILHSNVQSWGNASHDESTNIVKVVAPVSKTPSTVEALSMTFEEKGNGQVDLIVGWDDTMARLPITIK